MSPPFSESEDSPTDDDNKDKIQKEENKSKLSVESLENSFLLLEPSLKARKD